MLHPLPPTHVGPPVRAAPEPGLPACVRPSGRPARQRRPRRSGPGASRRRPASERESTEPEFIQTGEWRVIRSGATFRPLRRSRLTPRSEQLPGKLSEMEARKAPEVLPRRGFRHSMASIRAGRRRGSRVSLIVAFAANLLVAAAKLAAGLITGSAALLAEAAHSGADSTNEILLGVSFRRARRPPDAEHPFGYGGLRFLWAFSRPSPRF